MGIGIQRDFLKPGKNNAITGDQIIFWQRMVLDFSKNAIPISKVATQNVLCLFHVRIYGCVFWIGVMGLLKQ